MAMAGLAAALHRVSYTFVRGAAHYFETHSQEISEDPESSYVDLLDMFCRAEQTQPVRQIRLWLREDEAAVIRHLEGDPRETCLAFLVIDLIAFCVKNPDDLEEPPPLPTRQLGGHHLPPPPPPPPPPLASAETDSATRSLRVLEHEFDQLELALNSNLETAKGRFGVGDAVSPPIATTESETVPRRRPGIPPPPPAPYASTLSSPSTTAASSASTDGMSSPSQLSPPARPQQPPPRKISTLLSSLAARVAPSPALATASATSTTSSPPDGASTVRTDDEGRSWPWSSWAQSASNQQSSAHMSDSDDDGGPDATSTTSFNERILLAKFFSSREHGAPAEPLAVPVDLANIPQTIGWNNSTLPSLSTSSWKSSKSTILTVTPNADAEQPVTIMVGHTTPLINVNVHYKRRAYTLEAADAAESASRSTSPPPNTSTVAAGGSILRGLNNSTSLDSFEIKPRSSSTPGGSTQLRTVQ